VCYLAGAAGAVYVILTSGTMLLWNYSSFQDFGTAADCWKDGWA